MAKQSWSAGTSLATSERGHRPHVLGPGAMLGGLGVLAHYSWPDKYNRKGQKGPST